MLWYSEMNDFKLLGGFGNRRTNGRTLVVVESLSRLKIGFLKFDQCGRGSGMFGWSKRLRLLNLSLIYEIMKICEKKLSTLSTGNLPAMTTLSQFLLK